MNRVLELLRRRSQELDNFSFAKLKISISHLDHLYIR